MSNLIISPSPDGGPNGIGYWKDINQSSNLPDPTLLIDDFWDSSERENLIKLLEKAPILKRWRGVSSCRICGKYNGTTTLGYPQLEWPEGLVHYIRDHNVRLDRELILTILEYSNLKKL